MDIDDPFGNREPLFEAFIAGPMLIQFAPRLPFDRSVDLALPSRNLL
jgi:hypothetical protein